MTDYEEIVRLREKLAAVERERDEANNQRLELLFFQHREYDDNPSAAFANRRKLARAIAKLLELDEAATKALMPDAEAWGADIIKRIVRQATERTEQAEASLAQLRESLRDPAFVHTALLRGDIARPSEGNLRHLYPEWQQADQRAEQAEARLAQALAGLEHAEVWIAERTSDLDIRRQTGLAPLLTDLRAALAADAPTPTGDPT